MHGPLPTIPGVKAEGDLAHGFRQEVASLLGRNSTSFPGAQPVSFERAHLDILCSQEYVECSNDIYLSSQRTPADLVLATFYAKKPMASDYSSIAQTMAWATRYIIL